MSGKLIDLGIELNKRQEEFLKITPKFIKEHCKDITHKYMCELDGQIRKHFEDNPGLPALSKVQLDNVLEVFIGWLES